MISRNKIPTKMSTYTVCKAIISVSVECVSWCNLPAQGKGLMNTFWVPGKKVKDSDDETMLNPFQRLRAERPALVHSPSPSPPPASHTLVVQPRGLPRASPKPDEWPEAERRLSREGRQRSGTLPTLGVSPSLISQARRMRHGSLNHVVPPSSLVASGTSTPVPGGTRDVMSRNNSIASDVRSLEEFNLLRLRESISFPLPTISEASHSQLAVFAAAADETARQARRLADWAAELARAAARRESSVDVSYPPCPDGVPPHLEGTPVDPVLTTPPPADTDSDDSHPKYSCKIV